MPEIHDRNVIAGLHISNWQPRTQDRKLRYELTTNHNIQKDAVNVTKALFPQKPKLLSAIKTQEDKMRDYHKAHTLRYMDGAGILPLTILVEYQDWMNDAEMEFYRLVREWIPCYPQARQDAQVHLGSAFNEADYPSVIDDKYHVRRSILPIPISDHLILDIGGDEQTIDIEQLRAEIETDMAMTIKDAIADIYLRLGDVTDDLVRKMRTDNTGMRQRSIDNYLAALQTLRCLNITNDKTLDVMNTAIAARVEQWTATDLNKDPYAREQLASEIETMAKFAKENMNASYS